MEDPDAPQQEKKKYEARCCKCNAMSEVRNWQLTTAKNNRKMVRGECSKCGQRVCTFVSSSK